VVYIVVVIHLELIVRRCQVIRILVTSHQTGECYADDKEQKEMQHKKLHGYTNTQCTISCKIKRWPHTKNTSAESSLHLVRILSFLFVCAIACAVTPTSAILSTFKLLQVDVSASSADTAYAVRSRAPAILTIKYITILGQKSTTTAKTSCSGNR
jgi:hypothetical protein